MNFSFEEMPDSRQQQKDSYTLRYKAVGEQNDSIVSFYARSATPVTVFTPDGILHRQNVSIDPAGFAQYVVTTTYGKTKRETGTYSFTFDTSGGTVKITAAKEHIASYPADAANENPHKGSIGVTKDGEVEGVEIIIPALKLSVSFRHPQGVVTLEHARALANATGHTNSESFLVFDEGELLFIGASGSDGSEAEAEVTYQFVASSNADDLSIGEIVNINKKGHDYLWMEFEEAESGETQVGTKPKRAHVERVYGAINFADTFGWS